MRCNGGRCAAARGGLGGSSMAPTAARVLRCARLPSACFPRLPIPLHPPRLPRTGLVRDLRELPSKQALQLRSDAATTAAALAGQQGAVAKMARRLAKQYGI